MEFHVEITKTESCFCGMRNWWKMKTTSRFLRPLAPDTPTKDLHFKMCIHTHTRRESPGRKPHQVKHSHLLLLLPSSPAERGGGSPSSARRSSFSSPSSYTTTTTTKSRVYLFCGVASGRLGLTQQPSIRSCAHAGPPFHQGPVFFLPFIQRHLKKQQQQCLFLLCVSARCRHTVSNVRPHLRTRRETIKKETDFVRGLGNTTDSSSRSPCLQQLPTDIVAV